MTRDKFALTIQAPNEFRAKNNGNYCEKRSGDFWSLSIREELISLWRKRGSDLGGGVDRTSGAEVGSGGRERRRGSGGEVAEERERAIPGAQRAIL